ncbi:MAG: 23S rRNA (pseudouridine(1915)-N(3))-methyltransferase RlmH [Bacteroidaceae bacterium]|nr:23S rRNA (pseudouridine(1915)-N(3))-methyltransferase RlmH [Bacteroidaceae bacterium]
MKAILLVVGKTSDKRLATLTDEYKARLSHYLPFDLEVVPDVKGAGTQPAAVREAEGAALLRRIEPSDRVVLLDEGGDMLTSRQFAAFVQKRLAMGGKRLVFVVGGATGFSPAVRGRADDVLSLSRMTMTHQMVRLFFAEQLYRAMTILRGEPYHND